MWKLRVGVNLRWWGESVRLRKVVLCGSLVTGPQRNKPNNRPQLHRCHHIHESLERERSLRAIPSSEMQLSRQVPLWKNLKLKTMVTLKYSNYKAPFGDEQRGLSSRYIALYARDKSIFDEISEDSLRWRVSSRTSAAAVPNVVMRTHLRRRWKNAFADALRQKGYELDGRKVVDGLKMPGLRGTLDVTIHNGRGMKNPYGDLLKDAQTTIAALEELQLPVFTMRPQQNFHPLMISWGNAERNGNID